MPDSAPEVVDHGGVVVISQAEDIDIATADALRAATLAAVPHSALGAVLDLSRVRYVDSAGIRMLLAVAERLRYRRQQLCLVLTPTSGVRRVLRIAGLEDALATEESVEAALARFPTRGGVA